MSTRDYLQHLLCCGNNASRQHYDSNNTMSRNDYEAIHDRNNSSNGGTNNDIDDQLLQDNPNYDSTFDLFEDVFGSPAKEPVHHPPSPKYTLESNGFYYSRQAESGSKYLLLGMMPDRELVGDVIKLDLEYSCMTQMRPGIKLQITGIHQKHTSANSQYRFKMKLVNIESVSYGSTATYDDEAPDATVCHVDTKFLSTDELKRHLFKIYSYNGCVLENLQLRVELYYKRNDECIKAEYLGKAKFTLNGMDPTGVSARKEGVLLRRDWKHRLSSS